MNWGELENFVRNLTTKEELLVVAILLGVPAKLHAEAMRQDILDHIAQQTAGNQVQVDLDASLLQRLFEAMASQPDVLHQLYAWLVKNW